MARTYLKKALLLEAPRRAVFQITERGRQVLSEKPGEISNRYLKRFEEFCEFHNTSATSNEIAHSERPESNQTATEVIETAHKTLNNDLASEVLDAIKASHQCSSSI